MPAPVLLAPFNGGLSAARSLRRRGEAVTVLASPSDSFTAKTRGVTGAVLAALPDGRDEWLARLSSLGSAAVLTGSDQASELLAKHAGSLGPGIQAFEAADEAHLPLMNKPTSYEIADRAGVRRPWSAFVDDADQLEAAARDATYPCIAKPALSHEWRAVFGDDRVILADSPEELIGESQRALDARLELIVSEYVPGGDDCVEEAILVRARDGSYPVWFGCKKLRQHPAGFGAASLCVSAPVPESMDLAKRLLDEAGYVGVVGVETKRHAETGEYFFIEANVRIPTQWGLGDASGGDSSWRMFATLAGVDVGPQPELSHGAKLVFPELELRAALRNLRSRPEGAPGLVERLLSWRGARDRGLLDLKDPGPALALARRALRNRLPGGRDSA
jgi:predicted ATP-grasp superfamily ATP-dependent carboligase